jgi:hypothetical protein
MKTKIGTNVSTFVIYYRQVLSNMFRPFIGHHQASHKNTNLSSCIELLYYGFISYNSVSVFNSEHTFVICNLIIQTKTLVIYGFI